MFDEAVIYDLTSGRGGSELRRSSRFRVDRWEAIRRLHAFGYSDQEIGRRTKMSSRTVYRTRLRLGLKPNFPGPGESAIAAAAARRETRSRLVTPSDHRCNCPYCPVTRAVNVDEVGGTSGE